MVLVDLIVKFITLLVAIVRERISKRFKSVSKALFNVESNFFDLMNAQILFWIGLYFSPFLAIFAPIYFYIKFYLTKVKALMFLY